MKAEIRVMPQKPRSAEDCQQTPDVGERQETDSPSQATEEADLADILISDF